MAAGAGAFAAGISEDALWRPFEQLSGGEKTELQLGCAVFAGKRFFPLIDEPTNHLDTESRQLVADYLKRQKGFFAGVPRPRFSGWVCRPYLFA